MYHKRLIDSHLEHWMNDASRKPLLLRGARQVGKSSAVRKLGEKFDQFIELNFEENAGLKQFFTDNLDPKGIVENLSVYFSKDIVPGKTLLFLDEIQACIPAISSLRFFYEKMPDLHVIAAGSLLEFALAELPSFGVGRVRSLFMYPFSFDEFLMAMGHERLVALKLQADNTQPMAKVFHEQLLMLLKRFLIIGGMPEAVAKYAETGQINEVQRVLDDLYLALKADFTKYKKSVPPNRLTAVLESVVEQSGTKFMYSKISPDASHEQLKQALELLIMAGWSIPVTHTAANGIPLGAETDRRKRKMLFFDTGIFQRVLDLNVSDLLFDTNVSIINKGAIAEMFWGLEYIKYSSPYNPKTLYYWHRERPNANAEVDYVIQQGAEIIPVEIKSSQSGSMQSMRQFLKDKNRTLGYRFSLENFAKYENIQVCPLYAVSGLFSEV